MSGQKYARMAADGVTVTEVFEMWAGPPITMYFTPEVVAMFHPCPDEVQVNWVWNSNEDTYSPPVTL